MLKFRNLTATIIAFIFFASTAALLSKENNFLLMDVDKVSRYKEDRVAYQRIEKQTDILVDNSRESLLVIKNNKMYLLTDGYDSTENVKKEKLILDIEKTYVEPDYFWSNKINGKPDYARVLYRRNDLLLNSNEEFVTTNFGQFYKTVRDKLIKLHVEKFRHLLKNRGESKLSVEKHLIASTLDPAKSSTLNQKYFLSASAKAADETVYYCEDSDGDGITETFTVSRNDGFDWGIKSGPNIIFIYGNTDKDIETLIGKLVNECQVGTVEEEKKMFQEFPTDTEVIELMQDITPTDRFYE